jgi:branched-chain amino acid aminotransferase
MPTKVYLSSAGRPVDPEDAKISVFDRGFLYGDSVYETLRTAGGRFVEMGRHLARLRRSAEGLGLEIGFDDEAIRAAASETCAASGEVDCYVRVIVTRGAGELTLDPRQAGAPLLVIIAKALRVPSAAEYERGIAAMIVDVRKVSRRSLDPTLKTGNYLNSIQALRQATGSAADDAIMLSLDGAVAEGATSNVFVVAQGRLRTPCLQTGLLSGITRTTVLELAEELGIAAEEATIWPEEARAAEEVFLSSSVRGLMPVTRLDGVVVGDGGMGPITRRLHERYAAYVAAIAAGRGRA